MKKAELIETLGPTAIRALQAAYTLKSAGMSWKQVAKTLDKEGIHDVQGASFSADFLKAHYPQADLILAADVAAALLAEWEAHMEAVAEKICRRILSEMATGGTASEDARDVPPEPSVIKGQGPGRRETRRYRKVSATMDAELWKLFQAELKQRRISSGRLIDEILWRHYGKPRLSYMEDASEEDE